MLVLHLPFNSFIFFSFTDPATTLIYTLSLHDALPIFMRSFRNRKSSSKNLPRPSGHERCSSPAPIRASCPSRSEEHTSELQSHHDLVCRLLLEKKKQNIP